MSNRLDNEKVIDEEYSLEKVIQRPIEPAEDKEINVKKIASRLDDDNDGSMKQYRHFSPLVICRAMLLSF